MENKYEMLVNLKPEMKKVYQKYFETEGYQFLVNEENIIFVKKQNCDTVNLEHEKEITKLIQNMIKKYSLDGILYLDFSSEMNSILQKSEGKDKLNLTDKYITWPIRQAIAKAVLNKRNGKMPKIVPEG